MPDYTVTLSNGQCNDVPKDTVLFEGIDETAANGVLAYARGILMANVKSGIGSWVTIRDGMHFTAIRNEDGFVMSVGLVIE